MTGMSGGDAAAWAAVVLFPGTAAAGWILRRFFAGTIVARMRPHFVLGYVVLALGTVHGVHAMGNAHVMSRIDMWFAVLALLGLGWQTFVGLSLQAPGVYRSTLRRWHVVTTWTVATLIVGHVALTM
jgi:cytochrome b561